MMGGHQINQPHWAATALYTARSILDRQRWQNSCLDVVPRPWPSRLGSCWNAKSRHQGTGRESASCDFTKCVLEPCWIHLVSSTTTSKGMTPSKSEPAAVTSLADVEVVELDPSEWMGSGSSCRGRSSLVSEAWASIAATTPQGCQQG